MSRGLRVKHVAPPPESAEQVGFGMVRDSNDVFTVRLWPLEQLRPDPENPRDITDAELQDLMQSIKDDPELLWRRPVLADEHGLIYAGNQRFVAFQRLVADGWMPPWGDQHGHPEAVRAIPADRGPVEERLRLERAARDNHSWGRWNDDKLRPMLLRARAAGSNLQALGFQAQRLAKLLQERREKDPGEPPPPPEVPITQPGDMWQLGPHRIYCADSTRRENLTTLLGGSHSVAAVVTDPPYAIYGSSSGLSASVTDDRIVRPFFREALLSIEHVLDLFGHAYVFCDWRSWPSWWEVARDTHLEPKNLLVWDKGSAGMGNNYANTHELIGFFHLSPVQHVMSRDRPTGIRQVLRPNIIRANRPAGADRLHNAAKPLDLIQQLIENSTDSGGVVADLFLGSGSTLLVAEKTDRVCYALDSDPKWADVAVQWWQRFTGLTALRTPATDVVRAEPTVDARQPRRRRQKAGSSSSGSAAGG